MQAVASPQVSADGMWFWDGRLWRTTLTADGRWAWDGRRWVHARSGRPKSPPDIRVSHLLGLSILDLVGFIPGVSFVTSAVAAAALLAIDPRGLVTLNGSIKWRRMDFRLKLLVATMEIVLFQFLVLAYLTQRLFMKATGAFARPDQERAEPSFETTSPGPMNADAIHRALNSLLAETNRLPRELRQKVIAVVSAVDGVLPAYRASALSAHDRFVVERTAQDYLPSAVRSYLKLPAAYRSLPLADAEGKTADQVLAEQLDLLVRRLRQVTDEAYRNDLQALLVHGRFLRSKFGESSLGVEKLSG